MLLLIYIKHVEATCNTTMYFRGNTSSVMIERYHVHQNEAALELYSRGRLAPTLSRWHLNSASNNIQCYDPRTRGFHSSISLTRITTHWRSSPPVGNCSSRQPSTYPSRHAMPFAQGGCTILDPRQLPCRGGRWGRRPLKCSGS